MPRCSSSRSSTAAKKDIFFSWVFHTSPKVKAVENSFLSSPFLAFSLPVFQLKLLLAQEHLKSAGHFFYYFVLSFLFLKLSPLLFVLLRRFQLYIQINPHQTVKGGRMSLVVQMSTEINVALDTSD